MKIYIILREDHGYLGYGPEIGTGTDIESVHTSLNDAEKHLIEKYENLYKVHMEAYDADEMYRGNTVKCIYTYFDEETEHAFEFPIYEEELA